MRVVVVPGHEDLAAGPAPEAVDQAVRRPVHGDIAQTDHRVVVQHIARPLLQQVAVAVVAVPERAAEDGDARLVFEVRVGEDPRPVFVPPRQPRAQEAPGCVQHGPGGAPVVSTNALVRDLSGQLRLVEPLKLELVHARFITEIGRPATSAPAGRAPPLLRHDHIGIVMNHVAATPDVAQPAGGGGPVARTKPDELGGGAHEPRDS